MRELLIPNCINEVPHTLPQYLSLVASEHASLFLAHNLTVPSLPTLTQSHPCACTNRYSKAKETKPSSTASWQAYSLAPWYCANCTHAKNRIQQIRMQSLSPTMANQSGGKITACGTLYHTFTAHTRRKPKAKALSHSLAFTAWCHCITLYTILQPLTVQPVKAY